MFDIFLFYRIIWKLLFQWKYKIEPLSHRLPWNNNILDITVIKIIEMCEWYIFHNVGSFVSVSNSSLFAVIWNEYINCGDSIHHPCCRARNSLGRDHTFNSRIIFVNPAKAFDLFLWRLHWNFTSFCTCDAWDTSLVSDSRNESNYRDQCQFWLVLQLHQYITCSEKIVQRKQ